ncbi:hypothetical protein TrST_g1424 [Triparma strigata]|uniref:Uncharacterized protein n=1 Tax=Triparma strigata TaxID=1606541 RepID=A0A9W7BYB2_9STRA|nr:hypothetical protein TrST_g1424 [Triparma strigata]
MVLTAHRPSTGFEAIEASILAVKPSAPNLHAGEAGGRGGRVMRREGSITTGNAIVEHPPQGDDKEAAVSLPNRDRTASMVTEANRGQYKKIIADCKNLVSWFKADSGSPAASDISLSDFKSACKSLGIELNPTLSALCENDDLSTNVRAIQLLLSKNENYVKDLDEIKKKERERRKTEREDKRKKIEAEKKAKKEAEEQAKRDAEKILEIEASIILSLAKGSLPTSQNSTLVATDTEFGRYDDNGLQFQFGSAEFSSLSLHHNGTFEFKNGYKMEFSSARQFIEQSEGLFDDLKGTYDIVWGEMKIENGKVTRRLTQLPEKKSEEARAPKRPTMENKRRSSRLLGSMGANMLGSTLKKMTSSLRLTAPDEPVNEWSPVVLEIILHPSDMEARRAGLDLTQRWGCYEPDEEGNVKTIQRKLSEMVVGEYVFPEKNSNRTKLPEVKKA